MHTNIGDQLDQRPADVEIERKYLLRGLPPAVAGAEALQIDQGYLPGDRINERIRRSIGSAGTKYFRTIKAGSGLVKLEVEEETTEEFFYAAWPLTRGARVAKRRYLVPEGDVVWEVDEFLDRDGMWLAEVELERADQLAPIPGWLAPFLVREVTTEKNFTNHALAK